MKKHTTLFALFALWITLACSFFLPKTQTQPNGAVPMKTIEAGQQNISQPTAVTPNTTNEESPIIIEIYEFKEGWLKSEDLMPNGNGWKPYHVKFHVSANRAIADLGYLLARPTGRFADDPHIITTDGHTYGNTTETAFTVQVYAPPLGTFGFPGIPFNSYFGPNSGTYNTLGVDFSVPENLTPQALVFPFLNYSIDLPPLGTEKSSEISMQTNQIVDFPADVAVDPNINVNVSDFMKADSYITINYQILNNNIAENQWGFYYAALVDSYGFISREAVDLWRPYSDCESMYLSTDDVMVGPGQTKTGTLCFKRNTQYEPSFYILYFTDNATAGSDNKAILIRPSGEVAGTFSSTSGLETNQISTATLLPTALSTPTPYMSNFSACIEPCDESNLPSNFPEATTKVNVEWDYENIPFGARYIRKWTMDGKEWIRYDCLWSGSESGRDSVKLTEPKGLHSGTWELTISVNDEVVLREQINVLGNWDYWDPAGTLNSCYGTAD